YHLRIDNLLNLTGIHHYVPCLLSMPTRMGRRLICHQWRVGFDHPAQSVFPGRFWHWRVEKGGSRQSGASAKQHLSKICKIPDGPQPVTSQERASKGS